MKAFVEISNLAASSSRSEFADAIRSIEDAGADGVSVADHLFATHDRRHRREEVTPTCDPFTTLGVVAGLSDSLELETVVANAAWIHPALVLRHYAQLARFVGGERVTAGLGAGWNVEEFDAVGMPMPPFAQRMDRLDEVAALARRLFDDGMASLDGEYVTACELPLSPAPQVAPRLLLGGGSDRLLHIAGRYADVVDLHGHPRRGKVVGPTMHDARRGDVARRALTTVADLEERLQAVRDASAEAGRPREAVSASLSIFFAAYGGADEVSAAERELCAIWAQIPKQRLDQSPFLLFGEPARMADILRERAEHLGLDRITILSEGGIAAAPPDPLRFCREVLPLLG